MRNSKPMSSNSVVVPSGSRVFVVSGIARPERFSADIAAAGWDIVGELAFRDHQWLGEGDAGRLLDLARRHKVDPARFQTEMVA